MKNRSIYWGIFLIMQFLLGFTNLYSFYIQNANNESDLSDKRAGLIQPNKSQIYTQLIDSPLIN